PTNASGQVSVSATANGTFGTFNVTAGGGTLTATFSLTIANPSPPVIPPVKPSILSSGQAKVLYPLSFVSLGGGKVQGTFTIANPSGSKINGPIPLVFPKLPNGVTVVSATSLASLANQQAGRITVVFRNPLNAYLGNLQFYFPAVVQAG